MDMIQRQYLAKLSCGDIPDMHQLAYVIIVVADALAPNRCQVISNCHADHIT